MKKIPLFFIIFFVNIALLGQNNMCAGATPLCMPIGTTFNYVNTSNGVPAQVGPSYGCLYTEPNANWFYVKTSAAGSMTYQLTQGTTPGGCNLDVDFICWGPYTDSTFSNACSNLTGNCQGIHCSGGGGATGNIVDCSYSTSAVETITIPSPGPGYYYMLLVTNYADAPGTISLTQLGGPSVGCCMPAAITATNKNICLGDTTILNSSVGNGGMLYIWTTGTDTISSDTIPFISVSPTVTTMYTLSKTPITSTCSASWDTLSVIVHQPGILAVNSDTICRGASTTLTASGSANYTWTPSTWISNTNSSSVVANPNITTIYTVTGDCANSSITATVTVNQLPVFSAQSSINNVICPGSADTLSVIGGAYTYTWMPASTLNSSIGSSVIATPTVSTTYTITAFDGYCVSIQNIGVSVNTAPIPVLSNYYSNQASACQHNPLSLVLTQSGSPNEFHWYKGGNYYAATSGSLQIPTLNPDTAIYSVIDSTSCGVSPALAITVIILPSPVSTGSVISQATSCNLCNGAAIMLASGGTAPYHYYWDNGDTTQSVNNLCLGGEGCNVYDQYGCNTSYYFTILSTPYVSYTLVQDTTPHYWDLYPNVSGGVAPYTYLWLWGDGTGDTTMYASHTYSSPGNYDICLNVTDATGCSTQYCQSDSLYRTSSSTYAYINVINTTTGIASVSKSNYGITVYPNPANSGFTIEANSSEKHTIQLFDLNGKMLLSNTIEGKTTIDASNLSEGIYNLSIISSEGVINKKLVIVR